MDVGGLSPLSCVCCRRGCHGDIQSPNLLEMVSIGFFVFVFLIQLLCLLLCRDLERMTSISVTAATIFPDKIFILSSLPQVFFFLSAQDGVLQT